MNNQEYNGYHGNKLSSAKNIFFLENCSQKIPIEGMLPRKRKCAVCKGKIEKVGGSWNTVGYGHSGMQDTNCRYYEVVFIAPSCLIESRIESDPFTPKIWGMEGSIKPEDFTFLLSLDLDEMGGLYANKSNMGKQYRFTVELLDKDAEAYRTYGHRLFFHFTTPEGKIWPNFASVPNKTQLLKIIHIVRDEIKKKVLVPLTRENISIGIQKGAGITKEELLNSLLQAKVQKISIEEVSLEADSKGQFHFMEVLP